MSTLPLLLPGLAVTIVLAVVAAAPLARFLRTDRFVAALLVVGFGIVLAATLSPNLRGLGSEAVGGQCDLSRWLPSLDVLRRDGDAVRNIVLFIPLGVAVGLLPWSLRSALVVAAAFLLTAFVEVTQLLLPQLERGCESADLVDNTIGLVIGLAAGVGLQRSRDGRADRT